MRVNSTMLTMRARWGRARIAVHWPRFAGRIDGCWQGTASWPLWLVAAMLLTGCAAPRPVIYQPGPRAGQDVTLCTELARSSGAQAGRGRALGRDVGVASAVGAAAAGAWGAASGASGVGRMAAAGAAAGASGALIRGAVRGDQGSDVYRRYVDQCLRDRGHQVVGWQ